MKSKSPNILLVIIGLALLLTTTTYAHQIKDIKYMEENSPHNPGWIFAYNTNKMTDPVHALYNYAHAPNKTFKYEYESEKIKEKYDEHFRAGVAV